MRVEKVENGVDLARRLAEEEEGIGRKPEGWQKYLIPTIAFCWSLFQLSIASWLILDTTYIRSIHLAFAMTIIFLNYPLFKKPIFGIRYFSRHDKIPLLDIIIAGIAAYCALYLVINYEGIVTRYGAPNTEDTITGILLVILLLEAARRTIGPALPFIATCFIVYAFLGPHMPDLIAFKGTSLNRFVGQMTMSTEGIYGVPLDVSATIVFLFVLFGAMLDKAGAGHYFIQLALSLLGGFKGGPAKAAIMGSGLTGLVSGSSIANIVTTGTFTIPMMKKVGYPPTKAAATEVAASTDGQLAPPIMGAAAFIIAEYVNVPYVEVVKAAAIPAFASYAALFYISHLEASKLGLRGLPKNELPLFFKTLLSGIHYLVPLCMLLYELVVVRHSPEMAAFNAIWVMAIIMFFQEPVKAVVDKKPIAKAFIKSIRMIMEAMVSGARNMVSVALATAAAGIIVGVVALGLGGLITEVIDVLSRGNIFLLLGITALASLIIGMGLPTTATYIIMAAMTAPAILTISADLNIGLPVVAVHLFVFYYGIVADDTPPVGLCAYAAAGIANSDPVKTGWKSFRLDLAAFTLPFMFIYNTKLLMIDTTWQELLYIVPVCTLGMFCWSVFIQGHWMTKTYLIERFAFLGLAFLLVNPNDLAIGGTVINLHLVNGFAIAAMGSLYLWQRARINRDKVSQAAKASV